MTLYALHTLYKSNNKKDSEAENLDIIKANLMIGIDQDSGTLCYSNVDNYIGVS